MFPEFSPPQYGWGRLFFQNWFRRGPLRAGHGIPSSTGGISEYRYEDLISQLFVSPFAVVFIFGRKKAHKHKLFALVNVQMALLQMAGCPRVNRAKKFMCLPRNTGNINVSLWLTGGLSHGCPDFQKVYVFKVYVPFSCLIIGNGSEMSEQKEFVRQALWYLHVIFRFEIKIMHHTFVLQTCHLCVD